MKPKQTSSNGCQRYDGTIYDKNCTKSYCDMSEVHFVAIEHKGRDYIFNIEKTPCFFLSDVDLIELLGDSLDTEEILELLNGLTIENKALKEEFNQSISVMEDVVNASYQHFKLKVFDLFDKKIAEFEEYLKYSLNTTNRQDISDFIDHLKEMKKELQV